MAEFPALPLWTDAYLGDTTHLDATEHGAYLLLLIVSWRTTDTSLPDDDALLAKYARCTPKVWRRVRPVLEPFFERDGKKWVQLRLRGEKQYVSARRDSAAANGRASALKRKERHATKRPTEREQSDQQTVNETPTPTPTPTPISNIDVPPILPRKRSKPDLSKPEGVDQSVWDDVNTHRKKKGAPLTETALKGIEREAQKAGWTLNNALVEMCNRGWQGFKADWVQDQGGKDGQRRNGNGSGRGSGDGFGDSLREASEFFQRGRGEF